MNFFNDSLIRLVRSAAILGCAMATVGALAEPVRHVNDFQWQHRLIVVNEPADPAVAESQLRQAEAAVSERDVVWMILTQNQIRTNYSGELGASFAAHMREAFQPAPAQVILIGKDGGVKKRASALALSELFGLIDTMPMRQREMATQ